MTDDGAWIRLIREVCPTTIISSTPAQGSTGSTWDAAGRAHDPIDKIPNETASSNLTIGRCLRGLYSGRLSIKSRTGVGLGDWPNTGNASY
jgi:hypothetical protein